MKWDDGLVSFTEGPNLTVKLRSGIEIAGCNVGVYCMLHRAEGRFLRFRRLVSQVCRTDDVADHPEQVKPLFGAFKALFEVVIGFVVSGIENFSSRSAGTGHALVEFLIEPKRTLALFPTNA